MAKKKIDLNNEIDRLLSPDVRQELDKAPPSPAFQQFLIRYLDVRDSVIINFISDNDEFTTKIANKVRADVAETYNQLAAVLLDIKQGQVEINKNIIRINNRLDDAEAKVKAEELLLADHEKRLIEKRERIRKLEEKIILVDSVARLEPTLKRIDLAFRWWKIVLYILALAGLVFVAVAFSHRKGWLSQIKKEKQGYSNDVYHWDKIQNADARAYYVSYPRKFTKAYKDSVDKADIERLTKQIDALVK